MGYGGGWVKMGRSVVGEFVLWVMVVGYGGGWVEMVMGRSVVVGGSAGDGQIGGGRIGDGELMVVLISVLIYFCLCFFVLVVVIWWWIRRRLWVDFGGCGFFFFSW